MNTERNNQSPAIADSTSVARGMRAACSAGSEAVAQSMLSILEGKGNAADAVIAGALVQAAVEPHMASLGGSLTAMYYDAKTKTTYALDAGGALPADLSPYRTVPSHVGGYAAIGNGPTACVPGFMPGLKALQEKFATLPWAQLCADAVGWADVGHEVTTAEFDMQIWNFNFLNYFVEGRELFIPEGFMRAVGSRFRNPQLADTLRQCAQEGPDHCIGGAWARAFVAAGNRLGWPVKLEHLSAIAPRWEEPLRFSHRGYEICQLPPPQRNGILCALVLGMLEESNIAAFAADSAERLYFTGHALRLATQLCGYVNDPAVFAVPLADLLDPAFHQRLAQVLLNSRPKVDMTNHVLRTSSHLTPDTGDGVRFAGPPLEWQVQSDAMCALPTGGRDLTVVDANGNWAQLMCTVQSGGIPGMVVGGVPMIGSHTTHGSLVTALDGWLAPGARLRAVAGNTLVTRNRLPVLALGISGQLVVSAPQVLAGIINLGLDPVAAINAPRMRALTGGYELAMEGRVSAEVAAQLARHGIKFAALPDYSPPMGSVQACWRDAKTGLLDACIDSRHGGYAGGLRS